MKIPTVEKESYITVHRQAILLLVVESGTRKFSCLSVEGLSVESGTYDVICQFCTVISMVVESEVLKAQNCPLSKISLPMHSNVDSLITVPERQQDIQLFPNRKNWLKRMKSETLVTRKSPLEKRD